MSLLLSVASGTGLALEGKSRTIQRVVLTAALTFVVALAGTNREIERVRGSTLASKTSLQGPVRQVERLRGLVSVKTALSGNIREIQRLSGAALAVVLQDQQRDKGSRRVKPKLPPEYRWPQPTPEQPEPLVDVVVQAQIQDVPLPKNPAIAMALRKAAERKVKPTIQKEVKAEKVVKKAIDDDDDDEDLFLLT